MGKRKEEESGGNIHRERKEEKSTGGRLF